MRCLVSLNKLPPERRRKGTLILPGGRGRGERAHAGVFLYKWERMESRGEQYCEQGRGVGTPVITEVEKR